MSMNHLARDEGDSWPKITIAAQPGGDLAVWTPS
jgi:hypothetical protein